MNEEYVYVTVHFTAVTESGELFACGEMDNGKLGCDADADVDHFSLQRVNILPRVIAVSCGHNHTVAVTGQCSSLAHRFTFFLYLNFMFKLIRKPKLTVKLS